MGEIHEASPIGLFGLATMIAAGTFWRFGGAAAARALLVPLLVVGLLCVVIGVASHVNNQKRIPAFEGAFGEDPAAFVQSEKEHVEGFPYMYTIVLGVAPACFALATAFFRLSTNAHLRVVGIALVLLGLSGLVIDCFSKARADAYYEAIRSELGSPGR